ncbi:zinc carboxypeptidase [Subsaximicrobium wynnwilliamsii]|uniref:Zinc carboxypeptidase n=1 Tax=Subsaximicrobium wynnwilliamsii TaxID=291179 RepID=A0A5C6ZMN6_9FLAO|nr:M14 family metallopeptidase [Subsaximicrobium wynnwilliamsii]TXD84900.1 zinc carboxypeptidase [Subsaximicrobium wynnwilliamsii]TXD90571.1 zinc carboxypeptidase [Subsaximicrobium wynnwilliamsii]TXE05046.1 zinc carboxypeptidase [Subsaximicrobium wynnwilliamsii]
MRQFILAVVLLFIQFSIQAQELQSPSAFLGYELGTQFSRQSQVVDYFEQVQKATPQQVKLQYYGKTNERRPLLLAFVSSEENLKNLEQIRENNLKHAGVAQGNSEANNIAIVWLSYNVHGNEASSTEAAMNTIYKLLTEKQEWLKNTVVIIDPCVNPDGRDRYVNWYNETASLPYDKDQQASEHQEPWPGGRPNHYLFDLNRDWVWATQVETQARLKVYNQWLPQIHVDFHEQGIEKPYYFAPAAAPFHEIISDWQRDFQTEIGKNNAKYFDQNGWLYFTRERFDLLYPSYGDTYPTYMGAIGMTYEQAGHGRAGLGIMTDEGEELTLIDRLKHHTTSGLSTVEMASKNAAKLNLEFAKFFDNSALQTKSYVLQGNADKIERLTQLLDKHAISYGFAQGGSVSGYDYASNNEGKRSTDSEDLVVSTNQPKGKMVKVLFEAQTKLVDSLTYDITAWSIPFAYGLDALASKSLIPTSTLGKSPQLNTVSNNATGYIFKWNSLQDAQFLAELLKANIRVRFTEKPMDTQGAVYNRGSLIVIRGDNKTLADFDAQLLQISNKHQRRLIGIKSGFSTSAPDFGSPDVKLVHPPKIALLSGDYTYSLNYGEIWYFFEQELQYPVTTINTKYLYRSDLSKYDILIMPNGNYSELLNDKLLADLKDWIRAGGKLIAIDAAMRSFVDKEGFGLSLNKQEADSSKVAKKNKLIPYADREREAIKNSITGAIFKTKVDTTHPMAFGYGDDYFSLKLGADSYQLLESGYNVAYLGEDPKSVAGFVGNEAAKKLDNSLVFGEQPIGQGSVIYMVDNVLFRNFWDNGKLFFVNALFYVGAE